MCTQNQPSNKNTTFSISHCEQPKRPDEDDATERFRAKWNASKRNRMRSATTKRFDDDSDRYLSFPNRTVDTGPNVTFRRCATATFRWAHQIWLDRSAADSTVETLDRAAGKTNREHRIRSDWFGGKCCAGPSQLDSRRPVHFRIWSWPIAESSLAILWGYSDRWDDWVGHIVRPTESSANRLGKAVELRWCNCDEKMIVNLTYAIILGQKGHFVSLKAAINNK